MIGQLYSLAAIIQAASTGRAVRYQTCSLIEIEQAYVPYEP